VSHRGQKREIDGNRSDRPRVARAKDLFEILLPVAVVVGIVLILWFAGREARDGRPGQHWVCTKTEEVLIDKFNGTETECTAGYWAPN
jgi:hypothetical protein